MSELRIKIAPDELGRFVGGAYPVTMPCPVCGDAVWRKSPCVFVHDAKISLVNNEPKVKVFRQHRVKKVDLPVVESMCTQEMFK